MEKSIGTKGTGINRTKLRSKVYNLFQSKDKDMIKMAQVICSKHKIRYYVKIIRARRTQWANGLAVTFEPINVIVEYTLYKPRYLGYNERVYGIWKKKKKSKRK